MLVLLIVAVLQRAFATNVKGEGDRNDVRVGVNKGDHRLGKSDRGKEGTSFKILTAAFSTYCCRRSRNSAAHTRSTGAQRVSEGECVCSSH